MLCQRFCEHVYEHCLRIFAIIVCEYCLRVPKWVEMPSSERMQQLHPLQQLLQINAAADQDAVVNTCCSPRLLVGRNAHQRQDKPGCFTGQLQPVNKFNLQMGQVCVCVCVCV